MKKLKFTKKINQLLQIRKTTLHLFFGTLPLHAVAKLLVDPHQVTATRLEFLDDLEDQVHSRLQVLLHRLPLRTPFLKLDTEPIIRQSFHVRVDVSQDGFVTACGRHDALKDQYKTASDEPAPSRPL